MARHLDDRLLIDEDRLETLARVASLYYEDNLTQQEISSRLGYSRSGISRLLTEARNAGVVEIRINYPLARNRDLEIALTNRFPRLHEVRVLAHTGETYEQMLHGLGSLAARLVEQEVSRTSCLGVSWGTAVYEVINALHPPYFPEVRVIQLVGALGTANPQIDGPELARWAARLYGGRYQVLPAPLFVDNEEVRDALLKDSRMREVLDQSRNVDVAIVGVGTTQPALCSFVRAGYLTKEELALAVASGAVGDVCGVMFNAVGNILDIPLARRVVGIRSETLRYLPLVIGVAGGVVKAPAILGALRAGLINALVTDEQATYQILEPGTA